MIPVGVPVANVTAPNHRVHVAMVTPLLVTWQRHRHVKRSPGDLLGHEPARSAQLAATVRPVRQEITCLRCRVAVRRYGVRVRLPVLPDVPCGERSCPWHGRMCPWHSRP